MLSELRCLLAMIYIKLEIKEATERKSIPLLWLPFLGQRLASSLDLWLFLLLLETPSAAGTAFSLPFATPLVLPCAPPVLYSGAVLNWLQNSKGGRRHGRIQ